jgi:chromosome partitioning protein
VNALAIADRVVVPSRADQLSYYGLQMLCSFVGGLADINPSVAVTDVFFTFYDPRMRLTRAVEESIRADYGSLVMRGVVRRGVAVSEPLADLRTVFEYKPESRVALDYVDVYREFCGRMGLE